jgi:predicted nucleotide-binding protein
MPTVTAQEQFQRLKIHADALVDISERDPEFYNAIIPYSKSLRQALNTDRDKATKLSVTVPVAIIKEFYEEHQGSSGEGYVHFGHPKAGESGPTASAIVELAAMITSLPNEEFLSLFDKNSALIPAANNKTGRVFIVHGHDIAIKESVARFVSQLGLTPIILHEQANHGATLIEKLEANSAVDYAIALLTPDDRAIAKTSGAIGGGIGGGFGSSSSQAVGRARQNVVFELGFFVGRLGRRRVSALYTPGVELPSDYHGVAFIEIDANQGWQLSLARDLKAVYPNLDVNALI